MAAENHDKAYRVCSKVSSFFFLVQDGCRLHVGWRVDC